MTVDDVVARATIKFERPLNLLKTKELLKYIAANLPCDFVYTVKTSEKIYGLHRFGKDVSSRVVHIDIWGRITCKGVVGLGCFECESSNNTLLMVEELRFTPIIEDRIEDYRPEVVGAWDAVRKQIDDYFKKKE
jgi:hypothetical protein